MTKQKPMEKSHNEFIPPKNELIALIEGTHPDCNSKPFTQEEIAQYYTKKYNRSVSNQTVSNWFKKYKIKAKKHRIIPIPPKEELIALYNGIHPDCNSKPFSKSEIANYYSKKYKRSVSYETVNNWFNDYGIKSRRTIIPVPLRKELIALYNGTHPDCNSKPFMQEEIAQYYTKKYNLPVSTGTVSRWFINYGIETDRNRDKIIPIPPKEELIALYNGTHPDCNNKPFTQEEIAQYYTKKYNRSVSNQTVSNWFKKYKIKAKKHRIIPIPPKEELIALYNGTHPDCNSKPFTQLEIVAYYSKKYSCSISENVVRSWFSEHDINVRDYSLPIPPKEELLMLYEGVFIQKLTAVHSL